MLQGLSRSTRSIDFIGLGCRRGIQADCIGGERLPRWGSVVFKAPDEDKRQCDEHHREPEPEKDFEKDASHCSAQISFDREDVSDSADGLNALLTICARPKLLTKIAHM